MPRKPKYAVIPEGQFNVFPATRRSIDDPTYRGTVKLSGKRYTVAVWERPEGMSLHLQEATK